MLKLALLTSGGGTTAEAILKSCLIGQLHMKIEPALVISSNPHAKALERAYKTGMDRCDLLTIDPTESKDSEAFGERIISECRARGVDIIGQYGWMVKTPRNVIDAFPNRMFNQHPGPLDPGFPDFGGKRMYGMRVHCARLYFVRRTKQDYWTEAVAQRVDPEFDKGDVLRVARVPIQEDDTPESLQARVLPVEHWVQIAALRDYAFASVKKIVRQGRLVSLSEVPILEEAKKVACLLYPKG